MSTFWAVVKKELASVMRDRTIVIAVLIQLFIASFSSVLLIGMLSLYDADSIGLYGGMNLRVGLVSGAEEPLTSLLSKRGVQAIPFARLADARAAFYRGEVVAILSVPQAKNGLVETRLYLPRNDTSASLIRMVLQEPLKRYENVLRAQQGIKVRYTDLTGKPATAFEFIYSVILPMLMFFPAFVAGGMVVDSLSEEVENNTLQTLLSAPISINGVVLAKITAAVLLGLAQCLAWLALLKVNQISVANVGWVLLLAGFIAGIISVGSALVAVIFQDRERSQFVYSLFLLAAASISYLVDLSPIKTLSRLAIGDIYTSGWNVLAFALVLSGLLFVLLRSTRRLTA